MKRFNRRKEVMRLIVEGIDLMWMGKIEHNIFMEGVGYGKLAAAYSLLSTFEYTKLPCYSDIDTWIDEAIKDIKGKPKHE